MSRYVYTLCQPPEHRHRHYKVSVDGGKPTWNGANKQRILGVTSVLEDPDGLQAWAASQATAASEQVARDWLGADLALSRSLLAFGELAALQPEWPDNVRDHAADRGTLLHSYLAARLTDDDNDMAAQTAAFCGLPYGYRVAVDAFMDAHGPCLLDGRVERAVGDHERAIAGTYDAVAHLFDDSVHRIDLKSSRTVQPKHFAQIALYERCAILCGENASDYLTILHVDGMGTFKLHSIRVGSKEHRTALAVADAYIAIKRGGASLAKLLKED